MKSTFHRNKINLTVAALAAGMGAYLSAHAQTNDQANVTITGQITANTCAVNVADVGITTDTGKTATNLFLGNVAPTAGANGTVATLFGNPVSAMFTLGTPSNPATSCTFGTGTNWDLTLNLDPASQITTVSGSVIGTTTFLRNGISGTNAVVMLSGGSTATPSQAGAATLTPLTLGTSTFLSGNNSGVARTGALVLRAQWARTSASAPTSGNYSQTIPLTVVYK